MAICPRWSGVRLLLSPPFRKHTRLRRDPFYEQKQTIPSTAESVDVAGIRTIGRDLRRPECILAERDGTLWSADARGGVMCIRPDGTQQLVSQTGHEVIDASDPTSLILSSATLPNGIAMNRGGDFIIANFGTDAIELMHRDGQSRTLYTRIDGQPLGKTNFVLCDSRDRIWFTVTTRLVPWTSVASNEKAPDGYVGLIDADGIRIVADGFVGTHEIRFDANEEWLYVVESNARHISRLRVRPDGDARWPRDIRSRRSAWHAGWIRVRQPWQSVGHDRTDRPAHRTDTRG